MSRTFAIFILFFLGSTSCTNNNESGDATSTIPQDSVIVNVDSLKLDSIRLVRDGYVHNRFDVKLQDWNSWQYYHAYYRGFAGHRSNVLRCLVSGYGGINIVSSLETKLCGQEHNRIEVLIGDTVYKSETTRWHEVAVESGSGSSECATFGDEDAKRIAIAIAAHAKETVKIKVYRDDKLITSYELDEFSKKAFADCIPLYNLMKQIDLYDHSDECVNVL